MSAKNRATALEPSFIEIYKLDEAGKVKVHKLMEDTVEAEVQYSRDTHNAKLDARDESMRLNREFQNAYREKKSQEEIQRIQKEMQAAQNKWQEFQKKSPFTPERMAAAIEAALPADQAKAGHMEFEKRKTYPFLRLPPAQPNPSTSMANPAFNQPPVPPAPMTPQTAQPTKFRNVTRVAPPQDQWDKAANQVITDRKFDADQTAKARAIMENVKGRVARYQKDKAADYEKARKISDAAARDAELKKLDQEVNAMYDEMMLRLDNVSRADQMPGAATMPAAKPAEPGKPTPPAGH